MHVHVRHEQERKYLQAGQHTVTHKSQKIHLSLRCYLLAITFIFVIVFCDVSVLSLSPVLTSDASISINIKEAYALVRTATT